MAKSKNGIIVLTDDYRIRPDQYCWILEIRSDGKDRKGNHKDVWTPFYYPTFEKIAAKVIDEELKTTSSMEEILVLLEESKEYLTRAIKKVDNLPL